MRFCRLSGTNKPANKHRPKYSQPLMRWSTLQDYVFTTSCLFADTTHIGTLKAIPAFTISRRSRQRERLDTTVLSICLFVCQSVCLSPKYTTRFSRKLSNLELWSLLTTYRKSYMGFSKNQLLDH